MIDFDIAVVGYMKTDRMHLVDQSMRVVEDMAVSKILQVEVANRALGEMIHNPHLVYCHMWLVQLLLAERMVNQSTIFVSHSH